MAGEPQRREPRIARELKLRLAFPSMDEFIERYALNISRGGIFVRTRDSSPPGTELLLDIGLETGDRVISGRGVVRWTTPPSAPGEPAQDPGMGIKFVELTRESRAVVELVVGSSEAPVARSEEPPVPAGVNPATIRRAPAKPTGPVVGIDLGTTNSCVAIARDEKAHVLDSKQGYRTIPSIVAYDAHGRLLVGHPAKAQVVVNPRHTVYGSKRLIGRPFASPTVQACRDRFHYEIVEAPDGAAAVRFAGRDYTLQQVAALILREMREIASEALGEPVARAVVTVPAYYNEHQRAAVRDAGRLAGLHVERIVNEPTAAALVFGYGRGLDQRVLVYDLGGGTFDASVLEIQGEVYEVVSTGGDTFLGGADFDAQLVDHLVWRFQEKHGFTPPEDPVAWQRLRDAAEETKVALSEAERAVASVPYLCRTEDGRVFDLQVEVTRAELESLTERLVDRTIEVCRDVLAAKGLRPQDIQEVLLVGGQSRMPLVWRKLAKEFGREPNRSVHPDEAVAMGAALLADSEARIDSVVLIDVLAMGIGIGLPGGRMAPLLPRNTTLPATKAQEIGTTRDGQTSIELQVFQGDSGKVSECEYLGAVLIDGLEARAKGEVRVAFQFAVGAEGLLTVTAREVASGRTTRVQLATMDTPEALRAKLQLPEAQTAPRGARPIDPAAAHGAGAPPAAPRPAAAQPAAAPPAVGRPAPERKGLFGRLFGGKG